MAVDIFLQVEGIKGDSRDSKHKDWIEIESFAFGASRDKSGGTAARANVDNLVVTHLVDASSPGLFHHVTTGKPIRKVTLELCRAMGEKTGYYSIELENCVIASLQAGAAGNDAVPQEQFSIEFGKITITYTPTDPHGGKLGAPLHTAWDLEKNRAG